MAKFFSKITLELPRGEAAVKRARFLAAALGTLLLITVGVIAWKMWPEHLPPPNGDPVVIAHFAATPAFARLPREQQDPYIDHMMNNLPQLLEANRRGEFTPTEARKAFDQVLGSRASRYMDEYYTLPPDQRPAYIDGLIKFEQNQKLLFSVVRSAGGGSGDRWLDTNRIKARVESMSPAQRAQFAEFVGAVRKRRQELGLSDLPPR